MVSNRHKLKKALSQADNLIFRQGWVAQCKSTRFFHLLYNPPGENYIHIYLFAWEVWEEVVGVRWCHHSPLGGPRFWSTQHMETRVRFHTNSFRLNNSKNTQQQLKITITPHNTRYLIRFHKNLQKESGNATVRALHPHTSRVKDRTVRCTYEAKQ